MTSIDRWRLDLEHQSHLVADQTDETNCEVRIMLGDNFLPYLTLSLGAALALGTGLALARPHLDAETGELIKAPFGRSMIQITIGTLAALWGLATLLT